MKFFHEMIKKEIKEKEGYINRIKKEIEAFSDGETFYNEIYDVVEELEFDYKGVKLSFYSIDRMRISFDVPSTVSIKEGVTGFIDALEEELFALGYKEDLDRSNQDGAWYYFYYEKDIDDKLRTVYAAVYIGQSEHCTMIEKSVWKKDIEYSYVCDEAV